MFKKLTTKFTSTALSSLLLLSGCGQYYEDQVRAPTDQQLTDARTGADLKPRSFLRDGVFHMQRVQNGSTVRVMEDIPLKKPNLPPFDVAYISRDVESVVLELASAAGESVVIPQGLRGRKITLVHSGADFTQMLDLVLNKAGYHYNYVDGVFYVTRYPIRNYVLEVGQATRKGGLIGNTELAAEGVTTSAGGSDINTQYTDQIWTEVKDALVELVDVGRSDLVNNGDIGASAQGISGTGELIVETETQSLEDLLPPPTLDENAADDAALEQVTGEPKPQPMQQATTSDHLMPEENASTWYKITESAGLITVRAAPEAHRLVEDYLEQVQVAAHRQVVVEARIVALIRDKSTNRGIQTTGTLSKDGLFDGSFGFRPISQLTGATANGGFLSIVAEDITSVVQSLSTLGDIYTLSSPSVMARNNQLSRVSITRQLGYVETEVETATGSTGDVSIGSRIDRARFKNAGTVMSVMPFIGKNKVQLNFRLAVATRSSDTSVLTSIGDSTPVENIVPNLANNVVDQDMVLEFGRVYAIGGLIETSTNIDTDYEPTFSQIPGLQEIFRRANNRQQDTEFIVLLRVSRA